jgi:basic amino acid/polyamine antiporter, APA family
MMESPAAPATWITFAGGYQSVYQALILVLAGVVLYAFLKAHRENAGQVAAPEDVPAEPEPSVSPQALRGDR